MSQTRRELLTAAAASGAGALTGCTALPGGSGDRGTPTARSGTVEVEVVDFSFDPVRARVTPGSTVEWINRDDAGHDVTSAQFHDAAASWDFASDTFGKGNTVSYTFDAAGVYEYKCSIHGESSMCGAVLTGDATLDATLPCREDDDGGGY